MSKTSTTSKKDMNSKKRNSSETTYTESTKQKGFKVTTENDEKILMLKRTIEGTPAYLGKVQSTVEQFGEIRTHEDKEKFIATMRKLENEVPRDIFPQLRREIKTVISRVAIQKNPQMAWKIIEEGYRSTKTTINALKDEIGIH